MSEIQDDTHDQLIKMFIEYIKWNERFERFGYKGSAIGARNALSNIRKLGKQRFQEIQARRHEIHGQKGKDEEAGDDN